MFGIEVSGEGATSGLAGMIGLLLIGVFALIILVGFLYRRFVLKNRVRVRIVYPDNKIKTHIVKDAGDTWELGECTYIIDNKKFIHDRWGRIIYFYYNNPVAVTYVYKAEKHIIKVPKKDKQGKPLIGKDGKPVVEERQIDGKILKGIIQTKLIEKLYKEGEMSPTERLILIGVAVAAIAGIFAAWKLNGGVPLDDTVYTRIGEACRVALTGG